MTTTKSIEEVPASGAIIKGEFSCEMLEVKIGSVSICARDVTVPFALEVPIGSHHSPDGHSPNWIIALNEALARNPEVSKLLKWLLPFIASTAIAILGAL